MHSLKLNIDDSVYTQFLSFVNKFKDNEVSVIEDKVREDFVVSSVDEVRKRVLSAESNAEYTSSDDFWSDIDKKIEAM